MFRYVTVFFFKQKTAYEMRISDWSSDVCSSDLHGTPPRLLMCEFAAVGYRRTSFKELPQSDSYLARFEAVGERSAPTEISACVERNPGKNERVSWLSGDCTRVWVPPDTSSRTWETRSDDHSDGEECGNTGRLWRDT